MQNSQLMGPLQFVYHSATPPHSQSNPIDLTLDDDDDDEQTGSAKRRRIEQAYPSSSGHAFDSFSAPSAFSQSSQVAPLEVEQRFTPPLYQPPSLVPSLSGQDHTMAPTTSPALAPTASPSSAFRQAYRPSQTYAPPFASSSTTLRPVHAAPDPLSDRSSSPPSNRNVIDLTGSPSPSPKPNFPPTTYTQPFLPAPLPADLPPRTPVCIGQLSVTALVLYPIDYLRAPEPEIADLYSDWAPVRLQYERNPHKAGNEDTIHIRSLAQKIASGESRPGENFGVIEQKVSTALGPMMGKGLIKLDAKARRGVPSVSVLLSLSRRVSPVCA
jgi:SWI/SNF-related matrix-associated actin-dependent regulator of chromatin subfamily A3